MLLRMGWLQFRRSWLMWITAIFIFIVAGWLIALCLSGIVALNAALPRLIVIGHDPTPLFLMPIILGGITLSFILKGTVNAVLKEFESEYQMWEILGTNSSQISTLVATQISITATIGSLIGFWIARISIGPIYSRFQQWIGKIWLPTVDFSGTIPVLILTVLGLSLICGFSGYINTKQILRERRNFNLLIYIKKIWIGLLLSGAILNILWTYINVFEGRSTLSNGASSLTSTMTSLILIQVIEGKVLLKAITKLKIAEQNVIISLARWQVRVQFERVANTILPLLVVQTIIIGLIEMLFGLAKDQDINNIIMSFIVYIGAPLIVIAANIITLVMLKGRQQLVDLSQFDLLGFTKRELLFERLAESGWAASILLIGSLFSNLILYGLLKLIIFKIDHEMLINVSIVIIIPIIMCAVTWIILAIIDACTVEWWQRKVR